MMTCKNCNFDKNPDSAKECEMCGAELVRLCSCGFELKPHWKLCPECGTPVAQGAAAANAQPADGTGVGEQQDSAKVIEGIIRDHLKNSYGVYLSPMIPKDKLIKAKNHFITLDDGEDVLALSDSTFFGSCKNGWALTTKGLYVKLISLVRIYYNDMKKIELKKLDSYDVLCINGKEVFGTFEYKVFSAMLNDILEYINGQTGVEK